jgi:diguanylate cyclase (GGDEF)-like protein/PAS domain S-box-containing protein
MQSGGLRSERGLLNVLTAAMSAEELMQIWQCLCEERGSLPISFRDIVESANDIVIVTDANLDRPGPTILYVNPAFTRLTGYEEHEALGSTPRILQGPGTSPEALRLIASELRAGREVHQKLLNYAKSGAPYWLDLRIVPMRDGDGRIAQFIAIERDVTLDKRRLDELEFLAERDTLTGIPNRRGLLRAFDAELQAARAYGRTRPCLAFVDVDHFKQVNDSFGHLAGDAVLFGVADRIAENVRRVDLVGRYGGEEFAVCMPSITLHEAAAIAERLRFAVSAEPFDTPAGPVYVTVSIGVAEAAQDEHGLSNLMARSDRAMYAAKQAGRDRVAVDPEGSASVHHRPASVTDR